MQKTKLFVTASAVCFALAGAAFSERQSESSATLIYMAGYYNNECLRGTESIPSSCSLLGTGPRCMVHVYDAWGNDDWVLGYASPLLGNLCLLELKANQ